MEARRLAKRMYQGFCLFLLGAGTAVSFLTLETATGLPAALALTTADCRVCHASGNNVDRHHNLIITKGLDCLNCHKQVLDPVTNTYVFAPFRDCTSCHSTTVHYDKHGLYIANWPTMSGVAPGTAPLWTQVMTFSLVNPAKYQYQVCYKCHSYNAFGAAPTGVSPVVSHSVINLTDQAMELNPYNRSAHPIQVSLNSQTGSYAPKALVSNQMSLGWTNVGTQKMVCSDCHAAPASGSTGATRYLLKGPRTYWPYNRNGKLWTLSDVRNNTNNWSTDLFCVNCHPMYSGGSWKNNVHGDGDHLGSSYTIGGLRLNGIPCVSCHVEVPHGYRLSRLIGYESDPAPYGTIQSNGTKAQVLKGFKKASSPFSYSEGNCYSTAGACGDHSSPKMTYDW
ncbi:cytochrome C [Geobacter grbiciae]|uniref:cytochrome C n=1 Tax=Geobacter grbiciae TaxID=155042 RepID=UPI001C021B31|nr:cytochrome C [Geobacter grbiciae]MBT1076873.1 cytochrome C [Geobacter grbiciae]